MALKPLEDRIVVKPGDAEETTASGLVIPDTAKEKPQQGEVIAVGEGRVAGAEPAEASEPRCTESTWSRVCRRFCTSSNGSWAADQCTAATYS